MWSLLWLGLFIAFVGHAFASPAHTRLGRKAPAAVLPSALVLKTVERREDDNSFDATDLSFIKKLAAIGDSYSAGIGAGDRLGGVLGALDPTSDWSCSRYDHSYPYLIHNDPRLGDPAQRNFQFKSCSGAVTKDVLERQIPSIDSQQQIILLSIGGNDVELVNILNQCIFQWAVLNGEQVAVAKAAALLDPNYEWAKDFEWDSLGRGCESQLEHTKSLIEGPDFSNNVGKVLDAAIGKLDADGMVYLTGYGKFFGEKLSPECDSVSWSTWIYKAYNVFQETQKLTTDHRRTMNDLVGAVNAKLKAAAEKAGDKVRFIDYDSYIGKFGGRYCEPGVDESTSESNTRARLMFYELNTWDPLGNTPWKRSPSGSPEGTFQGNLDIFAQVTLLVDPDAELVTQNLSQQDDTAKGDAVLQEAAASVQVAATAIQVPSFLPDGYGRVFHPQILLHEIISNLVIYNMVNLNEKRHGHPESPEVMSLDSCPVPPPAPPPPTGPPVTPLTRGPIKCFNEADFAPHRDIQSRDQDRFAKSFSNLGVGSDGSLGPGDAPVEFRAADGYGVSYDYSCSWVPGCITTTPRQSFKFPLDGSTETDAYVLVRENYTKCINGGVGGSCQVGCLLYTFGGTPRDKVGDPCRDYDCRVCGSPFEIIQCQRCCGG